MVRKILKMWEKLGFTIANCMIIVFLTACGNSTVDKSAVEMNSLELEEGRKGAETNINSNEMENEAVSEIEQKNVDDFTSKLNNSDKLEEWLDSLKLTEYKYCIWNEESLEGKVLENNQLYELKDNDEIILYKPEEFKRLSLTDDVECNGWDKHEKYNIMNLFLSGNVSFESEIEAKDGTIYSFEFGIISDKSEQANEKHWLGDGELESIVEKYEKVLSMSSSFGIKPYFGYNVPEGWKWDDSSIYQDIDGRKEERNYDYWISSNNDVEKIYIQSWSSSIQSPVIWIVDGEEKEVQSDDYEYDNKYNDEWRSFCKTGKWTEPKRPNYVINSMMGYITSMEKYGEIDTPYGKGVLYRALYEGVLYSEYDEEKLCYTQVKGTNNWSLEEGMIIEVDDYFVKITYNLDDWIVAGTKLPESLAQTEYTGRLEEIIPQMFETE